MLQLNRKLLSFPLCDQILKCLVVKRIVHKKPIRTITCSVRHRTDDKNVNTLFHPLSIKPATDQTQAGSELVGKINKVSIVRIINKLYRSSELKILAQENKLDDYLLHKGFNSFRKYCLQTENLPADLHILFSDISQEAANPLDLFPYLLKHIKEIFPHLECIEDLKKIGDLRTPAKWYQEARALRRKIIYHCGPTNSGKTHNAIKSFLTSKSGVYCGPLKLLAVEIFNKANESGVPCDLITGEEIIHVNLDGNVSSHVSCTVEMCSMENTYDVAVIDEIQMIKDQHRGWSWTRALLGVKAKEIHVCGEEAAVDLIDSILCTTNEEIEVHKYSRLTKLTITSAVENFNNIEEGDCIVCFNKTDIYNVTRALEKLGKEVAVIYGALPPGTKLAQCKKFNDPNDPCKILVATDAIGMGLNLSIRRIIFYSLIKPTRTDKGEVEMKTISVSQALQIAGRAGRYGTKYTEGFATTFKAKDHAVLESLLSETPEVALNAGLHPTIDQIELYSFYLPNLSLASILEIFVKLCTVDDSTYFVCNVTDLMYLANMLDHVNLPLRVKYIFCCAPINRKYQFPCTMLLKFAKLYSENRMVTVNWLCKAIDWPVKPPTNIRQFILLEATHDVLDLYLWLGYRFPEYFPDAEAVRNIQQQLDKIIQDEIINMTKLFESSNNETDFSRPGDGTPFESGVVDLMEEIETSLPARSHKNKIT